MMANKLVPRHVWDITRWLTENQRDYLNPSVSSFGPISSRAAKQPP
jgi:hypothetical protein